MARNQDDKAREYADIRAEFMKLREIKEFNVKKYTDELIFAKIGFKFYKSPKTIENIVFYRVNEYN